MRKPTSIMVDVELWRRAEAAAASLGMSLSELVEAALKKYLEGLEEGLQLKASKREACEAWVV